MLLPSTELDGDKLGDLSRGDKRDLIVKLAVNAKRAGAPVELIDAVMTFDDAVENGGEAPAG